MFTFPCGIHTDANKELSKKAIVSVMPAPKKVYIPLSQHAGAPARTVVAVGDKVKMGQLVGEKTGFISANVFSSVSGTVVAIEERATCTGKVPHIVVENDFNNTALTLEALSNPSAQQIIERVEKCGIVGMGGAGFPTQVKLSPKDKIDTFIINAAECEPYITCDYRILLDYTEQFLRGALLLAKAVGLSHVLIGIEDNKIDAVQHLNTMIATLNCDVEVIVLKTKYPQGAEKQLIHSLTGRKVPTGKLPSTVGCVVSNVHTALSAYLAVAQGQPLYKRIMTVTGGGIKTTANIWVSNGTLYKDIIEFCGGLSEKPTVKLINGGPMMGLAATGDEIAANKISSCLVLMTDDEAFTGLPSSCINCGRCYRSCPMKLMPMYIDAYSLVGDIPNAVKYGAMNCIECGCCAFVCPAKRPLTQSIRLAKKKFKEREQAK